MLSRLFIAALWSPTGKGLASSLLFVMFNCVFCHFPIEYLGTGVVLEYIECKDVSLLPSLLLFHLIYKNATPE